LRKDILVGGILLIIAGVLFLTIVPNLTATYASQSMSFEIPYSNEHCVPLTLSMGDSVRVETEISGGNGDVAFSVVDPDGYPIRTYSIIYSYHTYSFTATKEGTYYLCFDNEYAYISQVTKHVSLKITIKPRGAAVPYYIGSLFVVIGVVLTGIGVVLKPKQK